MHDPALYNLGYAYHLSGDFEQAIHSYQMAAELNKSPECFFNLASAYADNKDPSNAIKNYLECLKMDAENLQACINLGELEFGRDNYLESYRYYKRALSVQAHN